MVITGASRELFGGVHYYEENLFKFSLSTPTNIIFQRAFKTLNVHLGIGQHGREVGGSILPAYLKQRSVEAKGL